MSWKVAATLCFALPFAGLWLCFAAHEVAAVVKAVRR